MIKKLLEIRKAMKSKKPKFKRADSWKFKRLAEAWKKPKGRDHKIRRRLRGALPHPSYGSPKAVKGLHSSGLEEAMVHNVSDLEGLDPKTGAARIGGSVGVRKRLEIIKAAEKAGIRVLNKGNAAKEVIRKAKKAKAKPKKAAKAEKPKAEPKKAKTKPKAKAKPKAKEEKKK